VLLCVQGVRSVFLLSAFWIIPYGRGVFQEPPGGFAAGSGLRLVAERKEMV